MSTRSAQSTPNPAPTRTWLKRSLAALATVGAITATVLGVRWTEADAGPGSGAHEAGRADVPIYTDGKLLVSDTYAARIGLETEQVELRSIAPTTEVTGEVDFSPEHIAAVGARIFGRVRSVNVVPGQAVERGQSLAKLDSAELGQAQAELVAAKAQERFTQANHDRQSLLVSEGIAAHRRVEQATHELEAAAARRQAAEQAIAAMGGRRGGGKGLGRFDLRSPIDGEILEVNVHMGQAVTPEHTAFKVADLSKLWLELAVYESDLGHVHEGDEVFVRPRTGAGEAEIEVRGVVEHVASVIDPHSRAAAVRIALDNGARQLRVGQAVRATIVSRTAEVDALAIPRRAVVLVDGQPTVFVAPTAGEVVPRTVELGVRGREYVAVEAGLDAGEEVVVTGVFELKSELFR